MPLRVDGHDAPAVEQHQRAVLPDAAQIQDAGAGCARPSSGDGAPSGTELLLNCGSCVSAAASVVGAATLKSSTVTAVTGVGVVVPSRWMRDPVTLTSSSSVSDVATLVACWA